LYYEYTGNNYQEDLDRLLKNKDVNGKYKDFIKLMDYFSDSEQYWQEMEEVFHTN
jgi:L-rhamnose mutarotase